MEEPHVRPLFIYVSGPYSAPADLDPEARQAKIAKNIEAANSCALDLAEKGHIPFVPHTMMSGWEDTHNMPRETAMNICHQWVDKCDALFYMASSPGADAEHKRAVRRALPIYRSLEDVPVARQRSCSVLSDEAREALLIEYRECMESYRHTYATIWQAGGIFTAISAAVIALLALSSISDPSTLRLFTILAPVPFLFWWRGVFTPMNRYGELRNDRLKEIEEELSGAIPGLEMWHFRRYSSSRKDESDLSRIIRFKWLWRPRVKEVVTLFGFAVLAVEVLLLYRYFSPSITLLLDSLRVVW